jgi:hypothetical protein
MRGFWPPASPQLGAVFAVWPFTPRIVSFQTVTSLIPDNSPTIFCDPHAAINFPQPAKTTWTTIVRNGYSHVEHEQAAASLL